MTTLNVLTNNHLGVAFWEQRTGLFGAIKIQELKRSIFIDLLNSKSKYILIDFYFWNKSLDQEIQFLEELLSFAKQTDHECSIFVLSSCFAGINLEQFEQGKLQIIQHNYSFEILKLIATTCANSPLSSSIQPIKNYVQSSK